MKKIVFLVIILNLALGASQLVLANLRAGDGDQIAEVEAKIRDLSQTNSRIEAEIYSAGSLAAIQSAVTDLDFKPMSILQLGSPDLAAASNPSYP